MEKKEIHFLLPTQKMGIKAQNGGFNLGSLYFELKYAWSCLSYNSDH
jgi:hypothetical protein